MSTHRKDKPSKKSSSWIKSGDLRTQKEQSSNPGKTYPQTPRSARKQWAQWALWLPAPVCSPASELLGVFSGSHVSDTQYCWPKTIKQPVILPAKWVNSRTAKNCNLGHAICGEPQASQENIRDDSFFYRGEGGVGSDSCKQRVLWRKLEVCSIAAFHRLSCDSL